MNIFEFRNSLIGGIAIIEIKLARNAEARRAVIAQVLAYASILGNILNVPCHSEIRYSIPLREYVHSMNGKIKNKLDKKISIYYT